jgi:predicted AlkP superfamily pyrophosphatase or phosphodiesterase
MTKKLPQPSGVIPIVTSLLIFLAAYTAMVGNAAATSTERPMVILIGIDGFRSDYLARGHSPTLSRMASEGSISKGLIPSFPTYTFPNHVTLVTGRRPQHHGILNNTMSDPSIPGQRFRLSDRNAVTNPAWWTESLPVWVTAEKQGLRTATLFWPGSESIIQGVQPSRWLYYQHELNPQERVNLLLSWLKEDRRQPPALVTLYFSQVDSAGHAAGPDSERVNQSIQAVDQALADFRSGLQELGLLQRAVFIVVSDHGMSLVPNDQVIYGNQLLKDFPNVRWEWTGATSGLNLGGDPEGDVLQALASQKELTCWPKRNIPERLGGGAHRRIPDIVCLAQRGWTVSDRIINFPIPGQHGFDPQDTEMHGLLLVHGPKIPRRVIPAVPNTEVYDLLCALLGIPREPNDGTGMLKRLLLP